MGGTCSKYGGKKRCVGTFVGRPEERRPLGRPRRRWEHYITMDLQEMAGGHKLD